MARRWRWRWCRWWWRHGDGLGDGSGSGLRAHSLAMGKKARRTRNAKLKAAETTSACACACACAAAHEPHGPPHQHDVVAEADQCTDALERLKPFKTLRCSNGTAFELRYVSGLQHEQGQILLDWTLDLVRDNMREMYVHDDGGGDGDGLLRRQVRGVRRLALERVQEEGGVAAPKGALRVCVRCQQHAGCVRAHPLRIR